MKLNKLTALMALTAAALMSASAVQAAGPDANQNTTRKVELNFGHTTTFAHELQATSASFSGTLKDASVLATGAMSGGDLDSTGR